MSAARRAIPYRHLRAIGQASGCASGACSTVTTSAVDRAARGGDACQGDIRHLSPAAGGRGFPGAGTADGGAGLAQCIAAEHAIRIGRG